MVVGAVALGDQPRAARARRTTRSSKPIEKVCTGSPLSRAASAASAPESTPPESRTPTGHVGDEVGADRVAQPLAQLGGQRRRRAARATLAGGDRAPAARSGATLDLAALHDQQVAGAAACAPRAKIVSGAGIELNAR